MYTDTPTTAETDTAETKPPKDKPSSRLIHVTYADLKEVAEAAKRHLCDDGYDPEDAETSINAVWSQFKGREYTYPQRDEWHVLSSPLDYLAGALASMARFNNRNHISQEEHRKACERDCNIIRMLQASIPWSAAKYNTQADYVLGQIEETRNRIREYLDKYKG